jgi:4-carboxymuconolactone decarboxylase
MAIAKDIFEPREIGLDQLPPVAGPRLPFDQGAEALRATRVAEDVDPVVPGLDPCMTEVAVPRPVAAPRGWGLGIEVSVSVLIALGHVGQILYHLNRAMDNGLTKAQASEVLTHLAFYAGWPNAMSAVSVAKDVFRDETALTYDANNTWQHIGMNTHLRIGLHS